MARKSCSLLICCFSIGACKLAILLMSVSILSVFEALTIALTLSAVLEFSLRRTADMQIAASHYASSFLSGRRAQRFCRSHLWSFSLETWETGHICIRIIDTSTFQSWRIIFSACVREWFFHLEYTKETNRGIDTSLNINPLCSVLSHYWRFMMVMNMIMMFLLL